MTNATDVGGIHMPDVLALWPIDRLKPYERNPRTHSDEQIVKIAASLLEFGWTNPILVDKDDGIIAGHGRLLAARHLGMETVPVIVLPHLTDTQKRAYVIADNQLALDAGWDEDLLTEELAALKELDFDLTLTGFDLDDLQARLEPAERKELPTPEPPDDPVSRTGDLWLLGGHRLLCGDAGEDADVDRLIGGELIHMVNTDPPWNVNVQSRSTVPSGKQQSKDLEVANDNLPPEEYEALLADWFASIGRVLLPGRAFYAYGGHVNLDNYPPAIRAAGMHFSQALIWLKNYPVVGRHDFMHQYEMIFYGWREGSAHEFFGPMNLSDVWPVDRIGPKEAVRLSQKPVELAVRAIRISSKPGENVLDLFGGSGSTMIGAEETDRHCFTMELEATFCDVIVTRWQESTGRKATLDGTEQTFAEIAAAREGEPQTDD